MVSDVRSTSTRSRQLAVLTAFADEVAGIADRVLKDGGDERQAKAIASVLGLCIGKLAQANSALVRWRTLVVRSLQSRASFRDAGDADAVGLC